MIQPSYRVKKRKVMQQHRSLTDTITNQTERKEKRDMALARANHSKAAAGVTGTAFGVDTWIDVRWLTTAHEAATPQRQIATADSAQARNSARENQFCALARGKDHGHRR